MSGSLTLSGGENVPGIPVHAHPQFYVSGKRPMYGGFALQWVGNVEVKSIFVPVWNNRLTGRFTTRYHCQMISVVGCVPHGLLRELPILLLKPPHLQEEYEEETIGSYFYIRWASCQIRKFAVCACDGNAGNVSPATTG